MNTIIKLHKEAMDLAESAYLAKLKGNYDQACELNRKSFELEREAANLAKLDNAPEPSLSILHRSAASLAIDCGEYREAERLIAFALSSEPPDEIAEELRDLLEQVNFNRHLDLRGVSLEPNEFQYSVGGEVVSLGMALMDILIEKFKYIKRLIFGTAGRILGKPFSELNKLNFEIYLSTPRQASFAISFKLGYPKKQLLLPEIEYPGVNVIEEVIECMELFNNSKDNVLKERIKNNDYYNDFMLSANNIAPDGERITIAGLTSMSGGKEKKVPLTRISKRIIPKTEKRIEQLVSISGKLQFGKIFLLDEKGNEYPLIVPDDKKNEVIRRLTEGEVIITGVQTKRGIKLEDIKNVEINSYLNFPSLPPPTKDK